MPEFREEAGLDVGATLAKAVVVPKGGSADSPDELQTYLGPSADLSRQLNNAFALWLDLRVDAAGDSPVLLGLGGARLDITSLVRASDAGQVRTIKIPLRCFAEAGGRLDAVTTALRIDGGAGLGLTLRSAVANAVGEPLTCPPVAK